MIDTPTCIDCARDLVPAKLWKAADRGDRRQWVREGLVRYEGRGRCGRCLKKTPRQPRSTEDTPPEASHPCGDCGSQMIRSVAWKTATPDQRAVWGERGARRASNAHQCTRCYHVAYVAKRGNEPASAPKLDTRIHDQSPDVLTEDEGRWVTGRGPSGLPIQVWEAA